MKSEDIETPPAELCPVCGTAMVSEGEESYCPKCAAQINWGLEEDSEEA